MYSEAIVYSSVVSHTRICIFFFFSPGLERERLRGRQRETRENLPLDRISHLLDLLP